jgi:predicted MFS family arabinose efflux permease
VQGLSSATTWAGALAWVAVTVPRARRGQALGTVFGLAVLGFVVGPMFGGVADVVGIRASFVTIALVAAALVLALAPVAPPRHEPASPGAIARALRDRAFIGGLWLNTLPAMFFGVLDVLVPLRFDEAGHGALAIAAVFVVAGLVEVAVNPVVGRISDRRGRLLPVRVALMASIVVATGIAFATEPIVIAVLAVAASVTFGGFYTPGMALVADRAEKAALPQGIGFGVTNTAWAVGALAGPAIGGALAQALGDPAPYLVCAALCGLTLAAATRGAARLRTA